MADKISSYKLSPQIKAELHLNCKRGSSDFSLSDAFEKIKLPKIRWNAVALTVFVFAVVITSYLGIKHAYELALTKTQAARAAQEQDYQNRLTALRNEVIAKGTDAYSFVELSQSYLKSGDGDRALAAAEIATQKDSSWRDGFINLGQIYLSVNQFDSAKTALETALKIDPLSGQAHYYMSMVDQELNNSDASKAELAKAKEFGYNTNIGG
jgi:cytochrome c-type biogenesis protein CcmH/NrfG